MEQIKIHIDDILLYQLHGDFILIVSKRAKFLVLTSIAVLRTQIRATKFSLVFIRMIELLNSVVSSITIVTIGAVCWTAVVRVLLVAP